jgi:hypothetical protein
MQNFMQFLTGSASNSIFQEECDQKLEAFGVRRKARESIRASKRFASQLDIAI